MNGHTKRDRCSNPMHTKRHVAIEHFIIKYDIEFVKQTSFHTAVYVFLRLVIKIPYEADQYIVSINTSFAHIK